MADDPPALLRIERKGPPDNFVAVFRLDGPAPNEIAVPIPSGTAEENMVVVARDHFRRLMLAIAEATSGWGLGDDVRQRIDPDRMQPTGFENRWRREP